MQLIAEDLADACRVARAERTGCCSVVPRGNTDDAVKAAVGLGPVGARHHAICDDGGTRRRVQRACSIAAPRFAPSIPKRGPALVVFGSAASFRERNRAAPPRCPSMPAFACSPTRRRATRSARKSTGIGSAPSTIGTVAQRHLGRDCRLRHRAACGSSAEPHPRLQGFRQRRPHAGRQLRPRHARRRHCRGQRRALGTACMPASRPTSTSSRCACSATTARATPAT